jgi:[ribosomal protein S5]-alanine N-acetyltransferase
MKAPEYVETPRLILRKPRMEDAETIYSRYSSDEDVTRWLSWPRHQSIKDAQKFLAFSSAEWERWPAGPYILELRSNGAILGGTGFGFESAHRASTGYVLAKDDWNKGYATEALRSIVTIARYLDLVRLYALCHTENVASCRVLEKTGFLREGILRRHTEFPNLNVPGPLDVFCYSLIF